MQIDDLLIHVERLIVLGIIICILRCFSKHKVMISNALKFIAKESPTENHIIDSFKSDIIKDLKLLFGNDFSEDEKEKIENLLNGSCSKNEVSKKIKLIEWSVEPTEKNQVIRKISVYFYKGSDLVKRDGRRTYEWDFIPLDLSKRIVSSKNKKITYNLYSEENVF